MFSSIASEVSEMAYSIKPIDAARSFPQKNALCVQAATDVQLMLLKRTVISQYTERASEIHLHNLVSSARYT